jgi:hypothetical protein
LDNSAKENTAAAEMLKTPAMVVASKMDTKVELMTASSCVQ